MGDETKATNNEYFICGQWKTAAEYSKDFEQEIEKEKKSNDGKLLWSEDHPSDHLPVIGYLEEFDKKIVSWNILHHDMMIKHQLNDHDGLQQGLKHHKMFQPEMFEKRASMIVREVIKFLHEGYIVCLQEVSSHMNDILDNEIWNMSNSAHTKIHHSTKQSRADLNVMIYCDDDFVFRKTVQLSDTMNLKENGGYKNIDVLEHIKTKKLFVIANVHVPFNHNTLLARELEQATLNSIYPKIYVVGDFNASLYSQQVGEIDQITFIYAHPCFSFWCNSPQKSCLNTFMNTIDKNVPGFENGSKERMHDRLDHIMMVSKHTDAAAASNSNNQTIKKSKVEETD